jgi:hypothetical protein
MRRGRFFVSMKTEDGRWFAKYDNEGDFAYWTSTPDDATAYRTRDDAKFASPPPANTSDEIQGPVHVFERKER